MSQESFAQRLKRYTRAGMLAKLVDVTELARRRYNTETLIRAAERAGGRVIMADHQQVMHYGEPERDLLWSLHDAVTGVRRTRDFPILVDLYTIYEAGHEALATLLEAAQDLEHKEEEIHQMKSQITQLADSLRWQRERYDELDSFLANATDEEIAAFVAKRRGEQ